MDLTTLVNLAGVGVTAIATVVLAWLTGRYVRLTSALVEETKAAKEPNVYVDLEFSSWGVKLLIGNSGASPARNVTFEVKDNIPWRKMQGSLNSIGELPVLVHGISYLAPGRVLKYEAGLLPHDRDVFSPGHLVSFAIAFETEEGRKVVRQADIGLGQYSHVLFESFSTPEREIANAIKESASQRERRDLRSEFQIRRPKKACPTCGELIAESAKKCPHCWESLASVPKGTEVLGGGNEDAR